MKTKAEKKDAVENGRFKPRRLSKSQFTRGLQCPKSLWLYHHGKEHQTAPDAMAQLIFDQGTAAGELARKVFPGGVLIEEDHEHPLEAVAATENAVKDGAKVLYEAAAIFDNVLIRADILVKCEYGPWKLVEVKSSTSAKPEHVDDIAIQTYVLAGAGYSMAQLGVMHINSKYVRKGEIDVDALFILQDMTQMVRERMDAVPGIIKNFNAIIGYDGVPSVEIGPQCSKPHDCDFKDYCWKAVPEDSVWSIGGIRKKKAGQLWDAGHQMIADIPKEIEFKGKQLRQVESIRSGKTLVDLKAITEHLEKAAWPLHFLDFETVAPAVPPYDGMRPFQNLTFQASIHLQEKPGGDLKHFELLVDPGEDPRRPMADFLLRNIAREGSVVAYNAPFERGCIDDLGKAFKDANEEMVSINARLWDVAESFKKGHYMHPAFHGSWSLKSVLPVLIPTMSYAELDIAQGGDASAVYAAAMNGTLVGEKKDKAFKALREYCAQDTFATVKIFEYLQETVSTRTEHANKAAKEKMAT